MVNIATLAAGLVGLWLLLAPSLGASALGVGAAAVATVLALTLRLGVADREAAGFTRIAPRAQVHLLRFVPRLLSGFRIAGAALLGAPRPHPALVRVRVRPAGAAARAAFANAISATPGVTALDLDADSVLLHALEESRVDARWLAALEQRAEESEAP